MTLCEAKAMFEAVDNLKTRMDQSGNDVAFCEHVRHQAVECSKQIAEAFRDHKNVSERRLAYLYAWHLLAIAQCAITRMAPTKTEENKS